MTLEKSVLLHLERIDGCRSDTEVRDFARALARKRLRPAFPESFVERVHDLQRRILGKHDKNTPEGQALRALREIRVRAAPSWDAEAIDITFFFVKDENSEQHGIAWESQRDAWLALVPPSGAPYDPILGEVVSLADMTAQDYVESDLLDFDHLSSS
ncbi:hypothetical protein [Vulgatibacter sp.]|uniref:hypothetical protein n=1 Tax=Vulgatibacter sp. TaxID=1971226 RepID=UPI003569F91A